ncbi:DNA-binding protein [Candidatus Giovannonibacteria bacterium RIFCSPLOWO2_12_FULL_44_25]|uniref:DNA-binding protein HU n=3 Tax=Candidatus Giovannoniibacteriota TaxID=1752738 RepID=A0A0G1ICQ7_9BACT|nr:MAG: DNA-binding protein HU [Parcubacteria group bacterium GW2011_GWC1_44_10]KKT57020.1 MAG: DNA-binding protein HU [Candidatus Giovannonibacteria bacterium GW2011_GWB1_44_23]KKT59630.1 MAG: DNA-binding protein HU [Candidatus Giovannonibacteria bacterium GW2011_GWA1_44_25]OGF49823.1 MAG: DNA-binding protein [Candidatus Giovannonibacteria bacterium GWA2_45_15]OGF60218.1 MAG: DNA-binding protein [Candidatus Giovannonibacteria bacterium RIFCSPHIGHO2_01_FULL_44_100]OGF71412.1 MAG: DNA-binding p
MNKSQLAEQVYEMHTKKGVDVSKKHADEVVDFVFDTITGALKKGEEVSISGFGVFLVKSRKARTARNPRTGEMVQVPATTVPRFRAGKALKEAVK